MCSARVLLKVCFALAALLALGGPALALPFTVVIDIQPPAGQLEAGAVASGGFAHNTNNTNLPTQNLVTPGGDPFTLAIDKVNTAGVAVGGIDWRDRGDAAAAALLRLAEDFVKNNSGIVRVTLGDIPAGWYRVTSYHLDSSNRQCEEVRVYVSDAQNPGSYSGIVGYGEALTFGGALGLANITTARVQNSASSFYFLSDGTNPVRIVYSGQGAFDSEVPLNGIQIVPSAAPPSTAIPGFAGQDFDSPGGLSYRPTISAASTANNAYWGLMSEKPGALVVPTTFSGTSGDFWLGQRVNDAAVGGGTGAVNQDASLRFHLLDFTMMPDVKFVIALGAAEGVWERTTNYTTSNDYISIEMDADLNGSYETIIDRFSGPASGSGDLESLLASSPYFGLPLGATLTTLTYDLPSAAGQTVSLRLRYRSDEADETIAIDNILFYSQAMIPEPGSLGLLAIGLLGLARSRRRRRR